MQHLKTATATLSSVYYRQVQVGEVTGYELASSGDAVNINATIFKKYVPLVCETSVFYNVSGMDFGLFTGLKTESMEALLTGGVALATPKAKPWASRLKRAGYFSCMKRPTVAGRNGHRRFP
jgi:paraquat-inducible protein B